MQAAGRHFSKPFGKFVLEYKCEYESAPKFLMDAIH